MPPNQEPRPEDQEPRTKYAIALAALILAYEPASWLLRTWTSPAYASDGEFVALAVLGLFLWSATSARTTDESGSSAGWKLLIASAGVRAVGNLLAISVIGALTLIVDIYAAGRILRLEQRERAIAPAFAALAFAFALPLERIAQRVIGFGLQQISADGACVLLKATSDNVVCEGTQLFWEGVPVLVDLPCSGARGLLMTLLLFMGMSAVYRPNWIPFIAGLNVAFASAILSNMLRIAALALGIASVDAIGIDVMRQPWHDIIGWTALGISAVPLVVWSKYIRPREPNPEVNVGSPRKIWVVAALLAVPLALVTPSAPVDVSRPVETPQLPSSLGGHLRQDIELSDLEREYFGAYGGAVAKANYGDSTLLVVRTSSPLRHLHAPDECLRGAGFDVERLGIRYGQLPGAAYLATDKAGNEFMVTTTYVTDDGRSATSVSEAVFMWMRDPQITWTAIERIVPAGSSRGEIEGFDGAVVAALE